NGDVTIRAVFESHRTGKPRRHLTMHLAFGGASSNCRPSHQIGKVLWRRGVKELTPCGDAEVGDVPQQPTCDPQATIDVEAAVETGIIDQPLPADRCARLLEIDTHDDL